MGRMFFGTKFTWGDVLGIFTLWFVISAAIMLAGCTTERDCAKEVVELSKTQVCHDSQCRMERAEIEMGYYFSCEKAKQ